MQCDNCSWDTNTLVVQTKEGNQYHFCNTDCLRNFLNLKRRVGEIGP